MSKIRFNKGILKRHSINWFCLGFLIHFLYDSYYYGTVVTILNCSALVIACAIIYYSFCMIIAPLFQKRKPLFFILSVLLCCVFYSLFYIIDFGTNYLVNDGDFLFPNLAFFGQTTVNYLIIHTLSFSFYKKRLSIQNMEYEREKELISIRQEILFFKNQFNPHISFNFLNMCYRYMMDRDENGTKAIEEYSQMLRYTLNSNPSDTIALGNEVNYIEQYINLKKRIHQNTFVRFSKTLNNDNIQILPRILITFVENALKYGVSNDPDDPILILLETKNDKNILFKVSNRKKTNQTPLPSTKTGLLNAKNQLELFYQDKYKLELIETDTRYNCVLNLKL